MFWPFRMKPREYTLAVNKPFKIPSFSFTICLKTIKSYYHEFSGAFFVAEIFEKVTFDPYNFRITRLSAKKFEQMKNF